MFSGYPQKNLSSLVNQEKKMPTRAEFKQLAKLRLKEAETLFTAGLYDGAAYLCGYVVEFALKARICKLLGLDEYPETGKLKTAYAVHDFNQLLILFICLVCYNFYINMFFYFL